MFEKGLWRHEIVTKAEDHEPLDRITRFIDFDLDQPPRERYTKLSDELLTPAKELLSEVLQGLGFKAVDAMHIACAEQASCDVLLTTDDRMLATARRNSNQLQVRVRNPIDWVREVGQP